MDFNETFRHRASRSAQAFWNSSWSWPTDKHTDRPRYSVCSNRLHSHAKRLSTSLYSLKNGKSTNQLADLSPIAHFCSTAPHVISLFSCSADQKIGNESARIQMAQCRFPGLAISNAKIYIFRIKYTEVISSNSTRKLWWFEITKMLTAV